MACTSNGNSADPRIVHNASGCSLPEGQYEYNTIASVPLLTGTWVHCSGPSLLDLDNEAGIQLNADGTFTALVDDSGMLETKRGFDYQGTWQVYEGGFYYYKTDGGDGGTPSFENNPRRFALVRSETSDLSVYAIIDAQ